jgi:hypothetical protein
MFADQRLSGLLFAVVFLVSIASAPLGPLYEPPPPTDSIRQTNAVSTSVPQTCPVTQPPAQAFVPPSPYPSQPYSDGFWFGTEKLWVQLPTNGTWSHLPHYRPSDVAFPQKIQWWRKGYDWRTDMPSKLVITGRRLDSPDPPLASQSNASGMGPGMEGRAFIMSGLDIPTLGCWQVTGEGEYSGDKLTFVIWIAP